jgi:hypothetical protein
MLMSLLILLRGNWKAALIIGGIALSFVTGWKAHETIVEAAQARELAQAIEARDIAHQELVATIETQQKTTEGISRVYQQKLADLRVRGSAANARLLNLQASRLAMPTGPSPLPGLNAAPGTYQLPGTSDAEAISDASECEGISHQLIALQGWVNKQRAGK